jgi:hypothetical protein
MGATFRATIPPHACPHPPPQPRTPGLLANSDVRVGVIARRSGVPIDVDQWGWDCGFYPPSHKGLSLAGTAETFEIARVEFEQAWRDYLPKCTDADFDENRLERASTAWKYKMWDTGHRLPTQVTSGRSRCFCGASIDTRGLSDHVQATHMDLA